MSEESARQFAEDWYSAWNSHDLESILEHYSEQVVFASPFVATLVGEPDGEMRGKAELRHYFARALTKFPDLHFEPIELLIGVHSLVLIYRSVNNQLAAETMRFNRSGSIIDVRCHYCDGSEILSIHNRKAMS